MVLQSNYIRRLYKLEIHTSCTIKYPMSGARAGYLEEKLHHSKPDNMNNLSTDDLEDKTYGNHTIPY